MPTAGDSNRETRPRSMEFVPDQRPKHEVPLRVALVNDKDAASTAWVAQIFDRSGGQTLSLDVESCFAWDATETKTRGLATWGKLLVLSPVSSGKIAQDVVTTRCVLMGTDLAGKRTVSAGLVTRGPQDPALVTGPVDTSSCVRYRSPHLQAISLSSLKQMEDMEPGHYNCPPAIGFPFTGGLSPGPGEWCPRAWCLNASMYELNDAPVKFPKNLKRYLVESSDFPRG